MVKATRSAARIQHHATHCTAFHAFNALTHDDFFECLESHLPPHRERLFPPAETLSMFVSQALSADGSCQYAVDQAATTRLLNGLPLCSTSTGGYCRARQRLPVPLIAQLTKKMGRRIEQQVCCRWLWRDGRVRLVDGTTLTLADTPANQAAYPQTRNQRPGLGFPICRAVGIFNLADGALVDAVMGHYQGKGGHEQALLRELLDTFEPGDLLLADALYGTYFLLGELQRRGVKAVFEQHGSRRRSTDFRRGRRLGQRDHLITLAKPKIKPDWMSAAEYAGAPQQIALREMKVGGKILITTLLDSRTVSKSEIKSLYQQRWHVEVDFRHLKATLGMGQLKSRTPQMAHKELWVYLLAYNLIRWLMLQSAKMADVLPRRLSFKHSAQLWLSWQARVPYSARQQDELIPSLLELVSQQRVGNRPGRIEPRAVKRRPKPYGLLTRPRQQAQKSVRRYGHPNRKKGQPMKAA